MLDDAALAPDIVVRYRPGKLELSARITVPCETDLAIGLAAVIEETSGTLSYWALRHAPGKPDFHHPDAFALALDAGMR